MLNDERLNYDTLYQDSLQQSNKLQLLGEAEASFVAMLALGLSKKLTIALATLRNYDTLY